MTGEPRQCGDFAAFDVDILLFDFFFQLNEIDITLVFAKIDIGLHGRAVLVHRPSSQCRETRVVQIDAEGKPGRLCVFNQGIERQPHGDR